MGVWVAVHSAAGALAPSSKSWMRRWAPAPDPAARDALIVMPVPSRMFRPSLPLLHPEADAAPLFWSAISFRNILKFGRPFSRLDKQECTHAGRPQGHRLS